jgi:hypothetical protein
MDSRISDLSHLEKVFLKGHEYTGPLTVGVVVVAVTLVLVVECGSGHSNNC